MNQRVKTINTPSMFSVLGYSRVLEQFSLVFLFLFPNITHFIDILTTP